MAEFCKKCWLDSHRELTPEEIVETDGADFCESCGGYGKVVAGIVPRFEQSKIVCAVCGLILENYLEIEQCRLCGRIVCELCQAGEICADCIKKHSEDSQ